MNSGDLVIKYVKIMAIFYLEVLITTSKFAEFDNSPLKLLEENNFEYKLNPFERKLTKKELLSLQPSYNCLLAGLEILDKEIPALH